MWTVSHNLCRRARVCGHAIAGPTGMSSFIASATALSARSRRNDSPRLGPRASRAAASCGVSLTDTTIAAMQPRFGVGPTRLLMAPPIASTIRQG